MREGRKALPSVDWEREYEIVAQRRREAAENFSAGGPAAAAACGDLADRLREAGRLSEAEPLYREALDLWRKLALIRPAVWLPLLAESCGDLADLLAESGENEEALSLSREALGLWWELEAGDSVWRADLAESCGALAGLLSDAGQVREAEELSREALGLWRKLVREDSQWEADLADACLSLADLLASSDGESQTPAREPFSLSVTAPGPLRSPSRAKEAEQLYCEALDLYKKLSRRAPRYGADAVLVCNNLGTLLCGQGRRDAGEWFYRQAVDLHRKRSGRADSAPFAASACGNLAGSLEERNPAEAERLYRSALAAWRKLGEGYARETADACFRLASFLFTFRGDGDGAESLMKEALSLLRPRHGEAAAHIRRVLAEWGLADPVLELPAALPVTPLTGIEAEPAKPPTAGLLEAEPAVTEPAELTEPTEPAEPAEPAESTTAACPPQTAEASATPRPVPARRTGVQQVGVRRTGVKRAGVRRPAKRWKHVGSNGGFRPGGGPPRRVRVGRRKPIPPEERTADTPEEREADTPDKQKPVPPDGQKAAMPS